MTRTKWLQRAITPIVALSVLAFASAASAHFTQCTPRGADMFCHTLITVEPGGTSAKVENDSTQGPYDSVDDTLIGVQNNSSSPVSSIGLIGLGVEIFHFDGDGLCTFAPTCSYGPTTYEGPGTSFTVTDFMHGSVEFTGPGLEAGKSTYFSLEGAISCHSVVGLTVECAPTEGPTGECTTPPCPPHWWKEGVRQPENKPIKILTWGETKNLSQESPAGEINCKTAGGGNVENPPGDEGHRGAGGPPGVGETEASAFYECKAPKCEAEIKHAKEPGEPLSFLPASFVGRGNVLTNNFPWKNQLKVATKTDPNAYPFEEVIGALSNLGLGKTPKLGEEFGEDYPAKDKAAVGNGAAWGAPGAIGAMIVCEIFPNPEGIAGVGMPPRVAGELAFEGELSPFIGGSLNGPSAGKPSVVVFEGANTGALESVAGSGINKGSVKYRGYNLQEVIQVLPQ